MATYLYKDDSLGDGTFNKSFLWYMWAGESQLDEYDNAINEIHDKFVARHSLSFQFARYDVYTRVMSGSPEFNITVDLNQRTEDEPEVALHFVGRQIPNDIMTSMFLGTADVKISGDDAKEIIGRVSVRVSEFLDR